MEDNSNINELKGMYSFKDVRNILSLSSLLKEDNSIIKDTKPILKKKKKVTIKNDIDIINIEAWKKFNIDVSESGGCLEWDLHLDYEDDDIYEYENEICHIF